MHTFDESIKMVSRERKEEGMKTAPGDFSYENALKVRRYHKSFPEYRPTPLVNLKNLAGIAGVSAIYVKDESFRFGLNAFKVLGGSYCIGRYIAERLGIEEQELTFENLVSPLTRERLGAVTFVTATDGNHGRGIAWTAHRIGQKSVVYMPLGSSRERLENIRSLGAEAAITDMNYDDTVRFAAEQANKNGWVLVQDTAWEGYEKIPGWIMQGYMTMALESFEQLRGEKPTHIFLQAGVGSMAGAVAGFFTGLYKGDVRPIITIVEPSEADCIFRTAKADDGRLHAVNGKMNTMMAGLACGEPCSISWDVLNACATHFVSMPDRIAAKGMRVLANPVMDDCRVISGESGAAAFGFAIEVLLNKELSWIKDCLGLESNSKILCFSTEGDTDKENYRRIVWDGYEPS